MYLEDIDGNFDYNSQTHFTCDAVLHTQSGIKECLLQDQVVNQQKSYTSKELSKCFTIAILYILHKS